MQAIEKMGYMGLVWIVGVFIYSALSAYSGDAAVVAWFMSFGNSILNLMILGTGISLIKEIRLLRQLREREVGTG